MPESELEGAKYPYRRQRIRPGYCIVQTTRAAKSASISMAHIMAVLSGNQSCHRQCRQNHDCYVLFVSNGPCLYHVQRTECYFTQQTTFLYSNINPKPMCSNPQILKHAFMVGTATECISHMQLHVIEVLGTTHDQANACCISCTAELTAKQQPECTFHRISQCAHVGRQLVI